MGGQIPTFDGLKRKKSLSTDLLLIKLHLRPFFGAMLLTAISREALTRYIDARMASTVIRCGRSLKPPCAAARYRMGFHCFGACYGLQLGKITRSWCQVSKRLSFEPNAAAELSPKTNKKSWLFIRLG
jgi:hypothetical protein